MVRVFVKNISDDKIDEYNILSFDELIDKLKEKDEVGNPILVYKKKIVTSMDELEDDAILFLVSKKKKMDVLTTINYISGGMSSICIPKDLKKSSITEDKIVITNYYIDDCGNYYLHNVDNRPAVIVKNPLETIEKIWYEHNILKRKEGIFYEKDKKYEYKYEYMENKIIKMEVSLDGSIVMKLNDDGIMTYEDDIFMRLVHYSKDGELLGLIEIEK